jgi:hypothetical protein
MGHYEVVISASDFTSSVLLYQSHNSFHEAWSTGLSSNAYWGILINLSLEPDNRSYTPKKRRLVAVSHIVQDKPI